MPELRTATGAIAYEVLGPAQAETVLLVHNFLSTGRTAWGSIADDLSARYRVILPDLPGHGRSQGYPPGFDHRAIAAQITELLAAEGVTRCHLAGCSAGGMIALWMAHDGPAEPATLTLVSTTYSINPATTGIATHLQPEAFRAGRKWLETTARLHDRVHGAGYFEATLLPALRSLTPAAAIDLSAAALAKMTMPACVIHGADDEIFPVELARQMAAALPQAELHVVPGQSHALIFRQSWKVAELMHAFLADHPAVPTLHENDHENATPV